MAGPSSFDPFWSDLHNAFNYVSLAPNVTNVSIERGDKQGVLVYEEDTGDVLIRVSQVKGKGEIVPTGEGHEKLITGSIEHGKDKRGEDRS